MCFSAQASFTAGAVLMGVGVASIQKTNAPSQLGFASIPLLFSAQQFSEGLLWLSLSDPGFSAFYLPSMYFFFLIGQTVWPLWVPISIWKMEEDPKRKRVLRLSIAAGAVASVYFLYFFFTEGVSANIDCFHVEYQCAYPWKTLANLFYVPAIAVPFFTSSWKRMPLLGLCAIFSLALALLFYKQFSLSVWCFFAAWLSGLIYWAVVTNTNPKNSTTPSRYLQKWLPD